GRAGRLVRRPRASSRPIGEIHRVQGIRIRLPLDGATVPGSDAPPRRFRYWLVVCAVSTASGPPPVGPASENGKLCPARPDAARTSPAQARRHAPFMLTTLSLGQLNA